MSIRLPAELTRMPYCSRSNPQNGVIRGMSDTYPLMRKKRMVRQLHRTKSEGMTDELKVVEVVGGRKPPILKGLVRKERSMKKS